MGDAFSKLNRAMKEIQKANEAASSGNFIKFFKIPVGKTRIRILPASPKDDASDWFIPVGQHFGVSEYAVLCRDVTHWAGEVCPVCQAAAGMRNSGDTEGAKSISSKKAYYVRALVRGNKDATGVQYLRLPTTLFEAIGNDIISETEEYGEVLSWTKGRDIFIKRDGTGLNTKYSAHASVKSTPVLPTNDEMKELRASLESFPAMVTVPTEKELRDIVFGGEDEEDNFENEFEDEGAGESLDGGLEEEPAEQEEEPEESNPLLDDPEGDDDDEGTTEATVDLAEEDDDWGLDDDDGEEGDDFPSLDEEAFEKQQEIKAGLDTKLKKKRGRPKKS